MSVGDTPGAGPTNELPGQVWVRRIRAARASGDLGPLLSAVPYFDFLGFTARVVGEDVQGRMRFQDHLVGNPALPALHGGTLGALLEATALCQVVYREEIARLPKVVSLTVDYLRSARPVDTQARAAVTKRGRRVVNVRAEAWQEDPDRPVASATVHFLVTPAT